MKRAVLAGLALALVLPTAPGAASDSVQIRRVDFGGLPVVRVTAVVPSVDRPTIREDGRPAASVVARPLGTAQALMLAVDNSASMRGAPLREAKRAAADFLARQSAGETGLVAFGHEALALTSRDTPKADVARTLASLSPDVRRGTALHDAIELSASRLARMTDGARILVLVTDGRDVGSRSSLADAIAAAENAHVVVYPIAAGAGADREPLARLAAATGGRLYDATNATGLSATYSNIGRELARTWQISYLTRARPADRIELTVGAAGSAAMETFEVPGVAGDASPIPAAIAQSRFTALAVILFAALLLAAVGFAVNTKRRTSEIGRLLEPHVRRPDVLSDKTRGSASLTAFVDWTEGSLDELPGSARLARALERSGLKIRLGALPLLAGASSLFFGVVGTILGAPPGIALAVMGVGLAAPLLALRIAGSRRTKAFDKQLPDVLATVASTLRAGHGLRVALRAVADDGAPPSSEEFARVLGEERLGRPLDQAITAMCERVGSPDLDYVATAIAVQTQTGGSLAALFDTLSETVRERQRHARKVRALTSMGRMSAAVLIGLPFLLAGLMTLINRSYMEPLYSTSTGHLLSGICIASMAVGGLVLKKIVNVRY